MVAGLDRWGRSVADLVTSLPELSEVVRFVSLRGSIDLLTAAVRAFL